MTGRLLMGVAAALLGCAALAAVPDAKPTGADDVQDVVLLADSRPVLLRLHIEVDGRPFRTVHREAMDAYIAGLFAQLDADSDGLLTEEEGRRMPAPFKPPTAPGGAAVHVAFNYRVVDADGDGKISREELAEYHREFSGGPVQVQPAVRTPAPPALDQTLFALLDTNKDGKLSKEELAAAATVLSPLDQDHDELLTPHEVAPGLTLAPELRGEIDLLSVPAMTVRQVPAAASLYLLSTDEDRAGLASALRARYGRGKPNGELREPDAELVVRLGKRAPGLEALTVLGPAGKDAAARPTGDGSLTLAVDGLRFELRANEGRPEQPSGLRRHILDLFHGADAGNKGYVTQADAQQSGFFPSQFALLDHNSDGKLTERELTDYLDQVQDRQAALFAATPTLVASARAGGLFDWLDRDRDGRLSLRELREASTLPARMGLAADAAISPADFAEGYRIVVGPGRASLGRAGPEAYTPREAPMLMLDWSGPDLLWFTRMDRNRDGDISPREFLGTAEDFRRIDADGDGLISRDEAMRAAGLFKK